MKICYFGICDPNFGRNKVYIDGLRALGHEIIECIDTTPGWRKYGRLRRKHDAIMGAGGYDVMIVGYPGHLVVPFARRISAKPVIFDALCTLYEGEILSRGKYRANPFMRMRVNYIDEKAAMAADHILVETEAQKEFFVKRFGLSTAKVTPVYTGCDENIFNAALTAQVRKKDDFTVVFRGKFLPEAGAKHIIEAAHILQDKAVRFLILGHGFLQDEVRAQIETLNLPNLEWLSDKPDLAELARRMASCHVSLGQFEQHERLGRTIPHKAFESLALGLPYVTARAAGVSEFLTDRRDCLMVTPGDPGDLADKILMLKNDPALRGQIAANGLITFANRASALVSAREIVNIIHTNNLL
jgi:glycosyltransferase involved in cell wall biosynthesis